MPCSVTQTSQHCHALFDPMSFLMFFLHRKPNVEDEVGGVTSGGKSTCSSSGLVNWTLVRVTIVNLVFDLWNDPNCLHLSVQYFRQWFVQSFFLFIPSASFNEQTIHMDSILRWYRKIVFAVIWKYREIEVDCVDSYHVLSRIVLLCSS